MVHWMRAYQKVAKSCYKFHILYVNNLYVYIYICAKAKRRAKTGYDIVVVFAPSWASACSRLICEDNLILNSAVASLAPTIVPCCGGVAGVLPPSQTATDPPTRASNGSSLGILVTVVFSLFFLIFLFQNHFSWSQWADWEPDSRLTQLRPEWGQDRKAPWRVERIDTRAWSILTY